MSDVLPKYARLAVRWLVRRRDRESYLGDLEQHFQARKRKEGLKQANAWLRREIIESLGPLLAIRVLIFLKFAKVLKKAIEHVLLE